MESPQQQKQQNRLDGHLIIKTKRNKTVKY